MAPPEEDRAAGAGPPEGEGGDGVEGRGPGPLDPAPGEPGPGRRTGRKRRWAKRATLALMALVAVVVGSFFFLVRTQTGQRMVLKEVLERLQDAVNGRIVVQDVRARDLREGVTLLGVRIEGPEGRPFFMADSVKATYAWRTFLSGDVVLSGLQVFGPVLLVTKYPGEERFNADVIFRSGEEADTVPGPTRNVVFDDVTLVGGTVRVVYPEEGPVPERALTVTTPEGATLRRLAFDELNAFIPRAEILTPDSEGPRVTVADLSVVARLYEDPARLRDLEGVVVWANSALTVAADVVEIGETRASGSVVADFGDEDGLVLVLEMSTSQAQLADFQWVEPRIPAGTARGHVGLVIRPSELRWNFGETFVDLGESEIRADGRWVMADAGMTFDDLDLDLSPLDLARVRPWVDFEIPLDGSVRGTLRLDGEPGELAAEGRLAFSEPGTGGPATVADFRGVFHLGEGGVGVTGLRATLDPLDYDLVTKLVPASKISGEGRARIEATGRLGTGVRFTADLTHRDRDVPSSMVLAQGSVREIEGELVVDVTADTGPLSFTALRSYYPRLPVTGEVRGLIRAVGSLSDLRLTTDLETEAGHLALESRFDARDPGAFYEVRGEVTRFRLSALVPELPDPTLLSGNVFLTGRGTDPATATVELRVRARQARVGRLRIDTAAADVRLAEGLLHVDTLDALVGGVDVDASGALAVRASAPVSGEIRVAFRTDSIGGLRPLLLGDTVIARDTLSGMDRELLALEGIDPDTLPTLREVEMTGAASGEVVLRGSLESFSAEGDAAFERLDYGTSFIRDARVRFTARDLPGLEGEVHAEVEADSLQILGRGFREASLDLDYARPGGRLDLALVRGDEEDYRVRALFEVDTLGGRVELEELALRFDTLTWELARRAEIRWDERGFTARDLELVRPGPDPMRVAASGTLPREGDADFTLDVEGLELGRLTRLLQREDLDLEGRVGLRLRITGSASSPVIDGTLEARDIDYRSFELTRLEGSVGYRDRRVVLDVEAWRDDLRVLTAEGTVPADLALTTVEDRFPPEEIDLRVVADSLPAAFVLGLLEDLEDVEGTVNGEFAIGGTVEDPSPSGTLFLNDAGFGLPALGVRYRNVVGSLELSPDGTVAVDASARADGTVSVSGTLSLEPLTNPEFDLVVDFDRFRAVDRRDVEGNVSGRVTLTGTFQFPRIQGLRSEGRGLVVDRGTLFLEEFQRSATVVDLTDPRIFDLADTTFARDRPILAERQNPFLRNLWLNVDLAVEQDTWLRSEEMNVEIGGDLVVVYDRQANDLVLVGELQAIRGEYTILGRRFEVVEGVVEFVGTPGINPGLGITARTRVRRADAEPLTVTATVEGTLIEPRVELASPDAAVAEEDLISYLLFGRPSYALTSGQAASVQSAAGSLLGQSIGAGLSVFTGTVSSRLGTLVARELGFDYFAISQPTNLMGGGVGSALSETTVEVGQYLEEDLFAIAVFRPFGGVRSGNPLAGLRLEWTPSDLYTLELFFEDRFLRSGAIGFQDLALETDKVYGASVVWEWGY